MRYVLFSLLPVTTSLLATSCFPESGAPCYTVNEPGCPYCLGPNQVNPSIGPVTCGGDLLITASGLYWISHQDGMEFAIDNSVNVPNSDPVDEVKELNNLINAKYLTPDSEWNFGWKLGLGYTFARDGWDLVAVWTHYQGTASSHNETETDDNHTMIPLWSAWASNLGGILYATQIDTAWKNELDLVDIDLGRDFWTSRYLALRPHIGIRFTSIDQDFKIDHRGGSWMSRTNSAPQSPFLGYVHLQNDFSGAGIRGGYDATWHLGRGWSLFNNAALSALYGHFEIKHHEYIQSAESPFIKTEILSTKERFRATRFAADLILGVQWSTLFSNCRYQFTAALSYESHIFLNQNQMWRVNREPEETSNPFPNSSGQNAYFQRRGDLDYEGWTLSFRFAF